MRDAHDLVVLIKKAAKEAVDACQPSDFYFGKVTSTSPLKILVEQKMTLGATQLVLTKNVTDFITNVTIDDVTKELTIHNALKLGDEIILLKQKGGQKYLVVDRVVTV